MAARLQWVTGQLEYQRSREDARPYRRHYVVNDGKLLIVEFWPIEETKVEEDRTTPLPSATDSTITVIPPKQSPAPLHHKSSSPPQTCQPSSPHEISPPPVTPASSSPNASGSGFATCSDVVVKQEPHSEEMAPGFLMHPIPLLSPPPAQRRSSQTVPLSPADAEPNDAISRAREPSQSEEHLAEPDSLHRTTPSHLPCTPLHAKPMPRPTIDAEGHDVANIMRLVRATNHHQVILPTQKKCNYDSSESPSPRILISDRHVISWVVGNSPDFVSRLPPR